MIDKLHVLLTPSRPFFSPSDSIGTSSTLKAYPSIFLEFQGWNGAVGWLYTKPRDSTSLSRIEKPSLTQRPSLHHISRPLGVVYRPAHGQCPDQSFSPRREDSSPRHTIQFQPVRRAHFRIPSEPSVQKPLSTHVTDPPIHVRTGEEIKRIFT